MKIVKESKIINKINTLSEINELNFSLSDMFLSLINNNEIVSPKEIEILSKKFSQNVKDVYYDKILEYWDIDPEVEDNEYILQTYVYPNINELDIDEFLNNPYYKSIHINNIKLGQYELINDKYFPYEIFASDDIKVRDDYTEQTSLGFFKKEISFIALNYRGVTWMSVNPNEIKTMEKAINSAKGNVVVFGLGLGYYPYMISLKKEVTKITIIEKDKNIIKIFKEYILPQFEYKDKITIIETDALEYIKHPLKHDFAYVDLWHNAEDGLNLYTKFKSIEKDNPNCQFAYWLEDAFYALLRRAFISLLSEQLEGYKDNNYQKAETTFDTIINRLYIKTKNLQITSEEEIDRLLTDKSLLELYL